MSLPQALTLPAKEATIARRLPASLVARIAVLTTSPTGMPRRLECAETWAGNERTASLVELPGLVAWVHSVPAGPGDAGGDVHYVSVCPSCIVSRIALADVSGHGQAVVALGEKLRELMQQYLRALEQVGLMRDLNQAVREDTRRRALRHDGRGRMARPQRPARDDERRAPAAVLVSCRARRVELA